MRDKRFVRIHRGGLLTNEQHRKLIDWARKCSKHVLSLLNNNIDKRLIVALDIAQEWTEDKFTVAEAKKASVDAHAVARQSPDPVAKAIARSIGHAVATAHNDRGNLEISAKIWRHTGEKWSRQSEEMPLHRVLDLAILICKTRKIFLERYHKSEKSYPNYPVLDRIGIQGGAMNVAVSIDNEQIDTDINLFDDCLHKDDEIISERLNVFI